MARRQQWTIQWSKGKANTTDAFYIRGMVFMVEQGFKNEFDELDEKAGMKLCTIMVTRQEPAVFIKKMACGMPVALRCWRTTAAKVWAEQLCRIWKLR